MSCSFHRDLSPYLDGELDNLKAKRMKEHLKACAICREDLNLLLQIRNSLKHVAASTKAPVLLKEKILGEVRQSRGMTLIPRWNLARAATLVAMLMVAIILVFYYHWPWERGSLMDVVATMVRYHAAYGSGGRSLSFESSDLQNTELWLKRKLGFKISIPSAAFAGYDLEGADILEQSSRKFAYLKYQRNGKTIGYIVFEDFAFLVDLPEIVDIGEIKLHIGEERETSFAVWKKEGLVYLILTTEDQSELVEYARRCTQLF